VNASRARYLSAKLQGFGTTIFAEMSQLAAATGAVNLGQGFPDTDGPPEVLEAARAAIAEGVNQYPPGPGLAPLRHAIAQHQQRWWGMSIDPEREVLVTAGATEALAAAMLALLDTGDEVVMLEPMYDSYAAGVAMAGGIVRPVTLRPPHYRVDVDAVRAAITPRTRLLLLNTPHNPTGAVVGLEELTALAQLAVEHDLLVVSDEVYEHLTFDGHRHIPIATLPGMAERTLTISSGGKTFDTTGWKIGWCVGPPELVAAVRTAKQFLTYAGGGPFQLGIAAGLGLADTYFDELRTRLQGQRDLLVSGLRAAGFEVFVPAGTYFVTVDITPLAPDGDGMTFCRELPHRCGVVAIPNVVFYDRAHQHEGRHLVRFAFCKRPAVIAEAAERLATLAGSRP
jgi:N-succinyldiaminopimelate aminotransferase